jgi:flavin-binding protein dodecin
MLAGSAIPAIPAWKSPIPNLDSPPTVMSIAKVIEVIAEGDTIENAINNAVAEASKSVRKIKSVYVENIQAKVDDGKVSEYRVNAKITFVVD